MSILQKKQMFASQLKTIQFGPFNLRIDCLYLILVIFVSSCKIFGKIGNVITKLHPFEYH